MRSVATRRTVLLGAVAAGCASSAVGVDGPGWVAVEGAEIAYTGRSGRGPVIVFESGLGDGLGVWAQTVAELDASRGYFAYSRPGYEDSSALADDARTSDEAARLLNQVLRAARVPPPYLFVGHSLGGLYIAKYAELYPREIAGLVFVDGRPPRFRALCDERGVEFCNGSRLRQTPANWPAHIVAESRGVEPTEAMAPAVEAISGAPVTVITSTNVWPGDGGADAFALWLEAQARFANGFASHRLVRAEGAGHYVQREQPALVAAEIEALAQRISG